MDVSVLGFEASGRVRSATEIKVVMKSFDNYVDNIWQSRWELSDKGRVTFGWLPRVSSLGDLVCFSFSLTNFLTGHGSFVKKLHSLGLSEETLCVCGAEEDWFCVLSQRDLYADLRRDLLCGGIVYSADFLKLHWRELTALAKAILSRRKSLKEMESMP